MMNETEKLCPIASQRRFMGYVANFEELPKTVGEFKDKWGSYPIQWDLAFTIDASDDNREDKADENN